MAKKWEAAISHQASKAVFRRGRSKNARQVDPLHVLPGYESQNREEMKNQRTEIYWLLILNNIDLDGAEPRKSPIAEREEYRN